MYSFQWGRLESLLDQFWPLGLDIRFKNLPVSASEPHQIMHATNLNPETNRKKNYILRSIYFQKSSNLCIVQKLLFPIASSLCAKKS